MSKLEGLLSENAKEDLQKLTDSIPEMEKMVKLQKELNVVNTKWSDTEIRIRCAELAANMSTATLGSIKPMKDQMNELYDFITNKEK